MPSSKPSAKSCFKNFFETGSHVDSFAPAYHVAENDLELLIFLLLLLVLSAGIIGKGYHACLLH